MAGHKNLYAHSIFLVFAALQFALTYGAPQGKSSCPSGQICTREKCGSFGDGSKGCCVCTSWNANGGCSLNGWKAKAGGGECTLNDYPMTDLHLTKCPPGVRCAMSKCKGAEEDETCCKCAAWNETGSCRDDSWKLVKGTKGCSVEPGDGSVIWFGEILGQTEAQEISTTDRSMADENAHEEPLKGATIMDHDALAPKNQSVNTPPANASTEPKESQTSEGGAGFVSNATQESGQISSVAATSGNAPPGLDKSVNSTASGSKPIKLENAPNSNATETVALRVKDEGSAAPAVDVMESDSLEAGAPRLDPSPRETVSNNDTGVIRPLQSTFPSNNTGSIISNSTSKSIAASSSGGGPSNSNDSQNIEAVKLDIPTFVAPICTNDGDCGKPLCQGEGAQKTCCVCSSRDQTGRCLPNKWEVKSGTGTCDFIQADNAAPEVPIAIPKRGSAAPEEFVDLLPFTPCPAGVTCQTTKCAVRDGIEACCDCWVWEVSGRCSDNGWKPRGKGDCAFAFN